nr:nuclear transport factor 2 family protein [Rhodococcus sp. (in: high G+C Gram-positive bacteria)]
MTKTYFELAIDPDLEAYFAQFHPDATVEDEGRERHGIAEIRQWRTEVPPVIYTIESTVDSASGTDVDAEISGDFPGSPVMLHFHFEFAADGRIAVLRIRP